MKVQGVTGTSDGNVGERYRPELLQSDSQAVDSARVSVPPPSPRCKLGTVFCPSVHFPDGGQRNASNERFWAYFY